MGYDSDGPVEGSGVRHRQRQALGQRQAMGSVEPHDQTLVGRIERLEEEARRERQEHLNAVEALHDLVHALQDRLNALERRVG